MTVSNVYQIYNDRMRLPDSTMVQPKKLKRRSVVAIATSVTLGSAGLVQFTDSEEENEPDEGSTDTFTLLEGTEHETTGYVTLAEEAGPTVMLVGGIHGNEPAGWKAANRIVHWDIGAGTLVGIPESNPTAIEAGTRRGADGKDLNRQFPTNEDPQTELAQAIWEVVEMYEPDVLIDLHESTGIYAGDPVDGVGQAIFHSGESEASAAAERAIDHVNDHYIEDPELEFMEGGFTGPESSPEGLLVHKVSRETDAMAFLVETLRTDIELETRIQWQSVVVQQLTTDWWAVDESVVDLDDVDDQDLSDTEPDDDDDEDDKPEDEEPPTARIQTDPENADETTLELEQTVELDASDSAPGSTEIETYEWDVSNEGSFDDAGSTLEVKITACGEFPVKLRVTNANGLSDTEEIVLSTD